MAYVNSAYFVLKSIYYFNNNKKYLNDDFEHNYHICQMISKDIIDETKVDFKIYGKENVSSKEPILICSNHVAFFDIAALCYSIDKPLPFAAAKELMDNKIINKYIESINSVLIDRNTEDIKVMKKQLEDMEKAITETGLILFPEGECSYGEGEIKEFKKGGFIAAKKNDITIVPTYINYKDYKRYKNLLVPKDEVKVIFDKPFKASETNENIKSSEHLAKYTRNRVLSLKNSI